MPLSFAIALTFILLQLIHGHSIRAAVDGSDGNQDGDGAMLEFGVVEESGDEGTRLFYVESSEMMVVADDGMV
mgnify:CR=1 FL=1